MDEERRIPPFAEDTLTLLTDAAGGTGEGLPRDEAIDVITGVEHLGKADAEDALAQLESRGYIYFVDEQVRITPTDERTTTGNRLFSGGRTLESPEYSRHLVCRPRFSRRDPLSHTF